MWVDNPRWLSAAIAKNSENMKMIFLKNLSMNSAQHYVTIYNFFTNWPYKMAASAITKNGDNMKQTISHELPNGFCQNICHADAFIFLMLRHIAGVT